MYTDTYFTEITLAETFAYKRYKIEYIPIIKSPIYLVGLGWILLEDMSRFLESFFYDIFLFCLLIIYLRGLFIFWSCKIKPFFYIFKSNNIR